MIVFAVEFGISEEQAFRIGASFGGGMCKGEVCGAYARQNNLFTEFCPQMVTTAVEMVEEALQSK